MAGGKRRGTRPDFDSTVDGIWGGDELVWATRAEEGRVDVDGEFGWVVKNKVRIVSFTGCRVGNFERGRKDTKSKC